MRPCLRAALEYHDLGLAVVCVCPPDHAGVGQSHLARCKSPGKGALNRWSSGGLSRAEIERWFSRVPGANVGFQLGPASGLVALDVDSEGGWLWLEDLGLEVGPGDPAFSTSRGLRLLYRPSGPFPRSRRLHPKVELLSAGRITVAPPSLHPSGKSYSWLAGRSDLSRCPPLPGALPAEEAAAGVTAVLPPGDVWPEGQRNERMFRLGMSLLGHGATPEEMLECFAVFNGRCDPPVEESELRGIVESCFRYRR